MVDDTDASDRDTDELGINPRITFDKNFKCCAKPCKVCMCRNCYSIFHDSCTRRLKNVKVINDKTIECCDAKNNDETEGDKAEIQALKVEVHYLKLLVEEMREKIRYLL